MGATREAIAPPRAVQRQSTAHTLPMPKRQTRSEAVECPVCLESSPDIEYFPCSHTTCATCFTRLDRCPICRIGVDGSTQAERQREEEEEERAQPQRPQVVFLSAGPPNAENPWNSMRVSTFGLSRQQRENLPSILAHIRRNPRGFHPRVQALISELIAEPIMNEDSAQD